MIRRLAPFALALGAAACGEQAAKPGPTHDPEAVGAQPPTSATASGAIGLATPSASAITDAGAPAYDGPWAGATVMTAPIFSEMEWPPADGKRADSKSVRLGYMRQGEKTPVVLPPHEKSNCKDGWYQLVTGGYVCGKYITVDLNHPRFRSAHAPDLNAMLPYSYGVNATQGTPLYRQVPSREERKLYEPWLSKPKAKPAPDSDNPYASASDDGGTGDSPSATATQDDPSKPWYLRETDAAAPQVTLDELKEDGGPVARRMVKGFYLSLDHPFSSNGTSWWKTVDGLVAPGSQVYVAKPRSDFRGLWFDEAPPPTAEVEAGDGGATATKAWHLPIGFITSRSAHKHTLSTSKKHATGGGALRRFAILQLTGQSATIEGSTYYETDEGWWMRGSDGTITEPGPPPEGLGPNDKWIDVSLKRQTLVAFVGEKPVFATIVSSGRSGHETPPGSFRIREKHISSTMDGDAETASDGPYSIQDVPYIEYFSGGYALHGAFWHDAFGGVKSHGCVNMAPWDAKAIFAWTDPQLPEGWHGVMATKDKPGTRVVLHE